MRKKKKNSNLGIIFVMFGLGLILSFILPAKFLVIVLSIALVVCGVIICKS